MQAYTPHGSRLDFLCYRVLEDCGSSTFDVAFFIIENNWILPPSSFPFLHSSAHMHFCLCSLWACSVNRPRVRHLLFQLRFYLSVQDSGVQFEQRPEKCPLQHTLEVILQSEVAPASKLGHWDGRAVVKPARAFVFPSISDRAGIRREPFWPSGSWLSSALIRKSEIQWRDPTQLLCLRLRWLLTACQPALQNVNASENPSSPISESPRKAFICFINHH